MEKQPHISASTEYKFRELHTPLTLTEGHLREAAAEFGMEPNELLKRMRQTWFVEVIPDTDHAEL